MAQFVERWLLATSGDGSESGKTTWGLEKIPHFL